MISDNSIPAPLRVKKEWCYRTDKNVSRNDKSEPLVSIVIPSYNQGQFLESAIRSVLLQDYSRIECIVIDGGSTDQSKTILKHYEPWITYWQSKPDNGQADAINIGLDKASGDIAMFLNSDDMIFPGAVRRVVKAFEKHPDALVIYGHRVLIDPEGGILGWGHTCKFEPLEYGYTIPSECAYWRTNSLGEPLRFRAELKFALDLEFFCRLYKKGNFARIDSFLGFFRVHEEAKSHTLQDVRKKEVPLLWREYFDMDWIPSQWKSKTDRMGQYMLGIKHVRHVLFPWIFRKLKGFFKSS